MRLYASVRWTDRPGVIPQAAAPVRRGLLPVAITVSQSKKLVRVETYSFLDRVDRSLDHLLVFLLQISRCLLNRARVTSLSTSTEKNNSD
jgi:hypothetical protein